MADIELVINIPEEKLNTIKNKMYCGIYDAEVYEAIANGTPLPKGATNGDIIKAMFPNLEWIGDKKDVDFYYLDSNTPYAPKFSTFKSWWNAPYKEG